MPDIVVHNRMGREVYKKLPAEISSRIDREIFRIGLLGPDPYSLYRFFAFPFRNGIHRRMGDMHLRKTNDFLVEMAKHSRTGEMFSYLCGFMCHYALDSVTHPYINELSDYKGYMHMAIEHKLDEIELDRMGMKLADRPITRGFYPSFLPESMHADYDTVMKNVYGWEDGWTKFKASYLHHKLYSYLAEDPSGLINLIFCRAPHELANGKITSVSYRSHLCDGMSFEDFEKLRRKSVKRAIELIEAAYSFCNDKISEEELRSIIGYKNYVGNDPEQ